MYWHIDTDIVALIVICALYVYYVKTQAQQEKSLRNSRFLWCLRTGVAVTLIDIAASIVMEVPVSPVVYQLLMTLYYITIELGIIVWFYYAIAILYHDNEKRKHVVSRIVVVPYLCYVLLACSNPWTGLFFTLEAGNLYQRGPLFFLMVVLYAFYSLALLIMIFLRRKHIPEKYPGNVLLLIPIIVAVSIVVQLSVPGWLTILPGYMICLVLAFLFLQNVKIKGERAQLQQLTELVENFSCGLAICHISAEGRLEVQYLSKGYAAICQEESESLLRRYKEDILTGIHPEDRDWVQAKLETVAKTRRGHEMTYRYITAENHLKWLNVRTKVVSQPDGTAICYATYYDMTQERLAEQKLLENEKELWAKYELERNRKTVDADHLLVHAVFNLTTDETVEYVCREDAGLSAEQQNSFAFSEKNAELLIDREEREKFLALNNKEALLERFSNGETEFRLDYRRQLPGGDITWIRSSLHMVRDPRNGDVLLFEYWYDIEEEKMLEMMYRSLASENYDYVGRINGKSRRFVVFPKEGLTYRMPPLQGEDADAITLELYSGGIVPEDREMVIRNTLVETIKKNLDELGRYQFTYREIQPDESILYKRITQYYLDPQRQIIIMTREDVTETIQTESAKNAALASALEVANQASQAKTQFLSRVSHELRTPLNAIIGFMELAKGADAQQMESYLSNSDMAAKQLLSIINDVLDMSSIESGKLKLSYALFDFKKLIHSLANVYESQCQQKGLVFEARILTPVDEWLLGDKLRLNQILLNLLNNAVKFTTKGRVCLNISQNDGKDNKVFIRFEVVDTGCGMSPEMLGRLFRPFEQEHAGIAQKYGGNGLGLSIVNNLVQMMGGVVHVESKQGAGSSFVVELPFTRGQAEPAAKALEDADALRTPAAAPLRFAGRRVLLAEDNVMNRMVAEGLIGRFGAECENAENGQAAVEMFMAAAPGYYDVILMDIQMPIMDGFEATKAIRESGHPEAQTMQILALTANAFNEDIARALSRGMNDHIAKPIEPEVLVMALEKAFAAADWA